MKNLLFLAIVISILSACQRPMQVYYQRTPSIKAQSSKGIETIRQKLSVISKQLSVGQENLSKIEEIESHTSNLIPQTSLSVEPVLEVSNKVFPVSHKTIIKQKLKTLPVLSATKINKTPILKSKTSRGDGVWSGWDKNLKLGVILTGLLILLAMLGVDGIALAIVAVFALWYLIRGLKRIL